MKIAILTYGSRGDVQPCLSLALALRSAGHTPLLVLPGFLRQLADDAGLAAVSLPGDIIQLSRAFTRAGTNPLATMRALKEHVQPVALDVMRLAQQACQEADLVVHTFLFTLGAHALARQLKIPDISVQFFPMFFASGNYPQLAFPELPLGRIYNRLTHHFAAFLFAASQRLLYPPIRKVLPDAPAHLPWPFKASIGRPATPLLLAYSPALVPPEPDWGDHVLQTGFWFLDEAAVYTPPPELVEFLSDGPPPVCAGFGSMIHPNSAFLQRCLMDGLRQAGQRLVILTGWDGWEAAETGPDRLFLPHASHEWLFPRCSAVFHHGGAGTTAAALRSGRPNVVLPLAADQPFWARRIHACGASPAPLLARTLSAAQVASATRLALQSEDILHSAAALGEALSREAGLQKALAAIEKYLS